MAKRKEPIPEPPVEPVRHVRGYAITFGVSVVAFALTAWLATSGQLAGWEYTWLQHITGWSDSWRIVFLVATIAHESLWFGMASVIVTFLLKMYRLAWRLSLSILLGFGLVVAAKHFIGRPRPIDLTDSLVVRVQEISFGYPSMHVMMITVILLTLLPYLPRTWRWVIVVVPIVAMALSRLYLGVHAPLDIVGGAAIAVFVVAGLRILPTKLLERLRLD